MISDALVRTVGGRGAGDRAHVRRATPSTSRCWQAWPRSAPFFDPAGMTARETMLPEAASTRRLDARPRQRRLRGHVQPRLHRRARHRRPADRHARRHQHDVGDRGGVRAVDRGDRACCASRAPARPDRDTLPEGVGGHRRGPAASSGTRKVLRTLAFVDLAATGLYMPMESVLFPKYFTDRNEPAQLGWVLMALSVGGLVGALGYAVLSKYSKRRTIMLDRGADPRGGDDGHRVPAAAAGDPGAVRGRRLRLRADRADLQLRHADPGAAAPPRPGGRRDGVACLRRGPARPDCWPARSPMPQVCMPRSSRCRCRCWPSEWLLLRCRRFANWIGPHSTSIRPR